MKKPFKFRYVNEIVGGFVLIVLVLLIAGVVIAGRAQGWFEPVYTIKVLFPDEGSFGLRQGSEVRVLETPAGTVQDILPGEGGTMEGILRVRGRFFSYLRDDSIAVVKRSLVVAGDAYVELLRGKGEPLPEQGAVLAIIKDTEILQQAESLLEEVRATTVPAIEQLQRALAEYTALASDLRNPEGPVQLLIVELQDTVREANRILSNVAEATEPLPRMMNRVAGELDDMPGLVYQTQATLQETEILIHGLQNHWLLRKYIQKDPVTGVERLAPYSMIGTREEQR